MLAKFRLERFPRRARPARERGFSLVELLVTVVIMAEVLVGLLILFDGSSRLARAQTHLAEIQQSLRVGQSELVRFVRMAGIGGLPITRLNVAAGLIATPDYTAPGLFPRDGYAISILNNVAEGSPQQAVGPDMALPGSDVLILRGVFTTPLFYLDPPLDLTGWLDPDLKNTNDNQVIEIPENVRIVGNQWGDYPQDLAALASQLQDAKTDSRPEALILRDTLNPNAYVVAAFDHVKTMPPTNSLDPATRCNSVPPEAFYPVPGPRCIDFFVRLDTDDATEAAYAVLTDGTSLLPGAGGRTVPGTVPVQIPTKVGSIGLLEEYRFFVRAAREIPGDPTSDLTPVLSRARFLPGTNTWIERVDVADNVIDLQIAIGVDTDAPGSGAGYGQILDNDDDSDEVLFNDPGDTTDASTPDYKELTGLGPWYDPAFEFHFLRLNTLVQGRRPDREHRAPDIVAIEDFNRGASFMYAGDTYNFNLNRGQYHRRWLQTVIELRNLQ